MKTTLKVLFLAAEADPFVKIGGLGDVAGSLPPALRSISAPATFPFTDGAEPAEKIEVDVRLVIPFHGAIQRQAYPLRRVTAFDIPHASGPIRAEALTLEANGLPVYFIAGKPIPPDAPVYTTDTNLDGFKFTFFSLAALELARSLNWIPHIIHANDWHTSPALYALSLTQQPSSFYYNTATVLGLHNLPYLGVGAGPALGDFGLPAAVGSPLPVWAQHMPLPLGLLSADHIIAASPTYAQEIMTAEFGSGLQDFLQTRAPVITGILNGIDTQRWDPRSDVHLVQTYNEDQLVDRSRNKAALQREFGLPVDENLPLLAMVTRMDNQKGVDLVPDALRQILDLPWQVIILGTGDPAIEAAAHQLELDYHDRIRAAIRFDAALSRRIYAGADMLLIPSRYEPCGLTQMIAMRYGCIPVARATGGLRDTIFDPAQSDHPNGFLFEKATSEALAGGLARALELFPDRQAWQSLQRCGMQQDFSWQHFARQYLDRYLSVLQLKHLANKKAVRK